jgi:hypothetical protein
MRCGFNPVNMVFNDAGLITGSTARRQWRADLGVRAALAARSRRGGHFPQMQGNNQGIEKNPTPIRRGGRRRASQYQCFCEIGRRDRAGNATDSPIPIADASATGTMAKLQDVMDCIDCCASGRCASPQPSPRPACGTASAYERGTLPSSLR